MTAYDMMPKQKGQSREIQIFVKYLRNLTENLKEKALLRLDIWI